MVERMNGIEFHYPSLEDKEQIRHYYRKYKGRSCENTFANVYLWAKHYESRYAVIEDTIVFKNEARGEPSFSFPVGEEDAVRRAVEFLRAYVSGQGADLRFYCVTREEFDLLESWWPGRYTIE